MGSAGSTSRGLRSLRQMAVRHVRRRYRDQLIQPSGTPKAAPVVILETEGSRFVSNVVPLHWFLYLDKESAIRRGLRGPQAGALSHQDPAEDEVMKTYRPGALCPI